MAGLPPHVAPGQFAEVTKEGIVAVIVKNQQFTKDDRPYRHFALTWPSIPSGVALP